MSGDNFYRGFVIGIFVAGLMLGIGAFANPNPEIMTPITTPFGVLIANFVIAGVMAGMYMLFHDKV
jgi:hypothetical protein